MCRVMPNGSELSDPAHEDVATLQPRRSAGFAARVVSATVMTINEREAKANNDSDGCEHRVKQGCLGTEQRPNATAPKEKN